MLAFTVQVTRKLFKVLAFGDLLCDLVGDLLSDLVSDLAGKSYIEASITRRTPTNNLCFYRVMLSSCCILIRTLT